MHCPSGIPRSIRSGSPPRSVGFLPVVCTGFSHLQTKDFNFCRCPCTVHGDPVAALTRPDMQTLLLYHSQTISCRFLRNIYPSDNGFFRDPAGHFQTLFRQNRCSGIVRQTCSLFRAPFFLQAVLLRTGFFQRRTPSYSRRTRARAPEDPDSVRACFSNNARNIFHAHAPDFCCVAAVSVRHRKITSFCSNSGYCESGSFRIRQISSDSFPITHPIRCF